MLDYEADHFCPVYGKIIDADLCYDSLSCLSGEFKISSTKELAEIADIETARAVCRACPYSDLSGGDAAAGSATAAMPRRSFLLFITLN